MLLGSFTLGSLNTWIRLRSSGLLLARACSSMTFCRVSIGPSASRLSGVQSATNASEASR